MKWSEIRRIVWGIKSGIYEKHYTVYYKSGRKRIYHPTAQTPQSHYNFISSAEVKHVYSKSTGEHIADIYYKER